MTMRGMILTIFLTGCATTGFRYPGPLGRMGSEPLPYADRIAPSEPEAKPVTALAVQEPPRKTIRQGTAVARSAGSLVGRERLVVDGESFRYDCSGLVSAAYTKAGLELSGTSASLNALARKTGTFHERLRPEVGDIVFFDNTWDRNGNGRRDDSLTHVAVVESIDDKGTQTLVHLGGKGVVRMMMNLEEPGVYKDASGAILNSYLRRGKSGERLTGQLWSGYGSLWALDSEQGLSLSVSTPGVCRPVAAI